MASKKPMSFSDSPAVRGVLGARAYDDSYSSALRRVLERYVELLTFHAVPLSPTEFQFVYSHIHPDDMRTFADMKLLGHRVELVKAKGEALAVRDSAARKLRDASMPQLIATADRIERWFTEGRPKD
jgi:hypothetical protein